MKRKSLEISRNSNRTGTLFSDWDVGPDYQLNKLLGAGSYGAVASATHIPTGARVAIK